MLYLAQELTGTTIDNISTYSITAGESISAWSSGTTYNQGDYVSYNNYVYLSVVNSNLNNTPSNDLGKWLLWEVSNEFAMFDLQTNTETICNSLTSTGGSPYNLTATINVDGMDYLAFSAVKGTQLTIVEKNFSASTLTTTNKTISNGEINYAHQLDASAYTVEITVSQVTGDTYSSIGSLIGGTSISLGDTRYTPNFSFSSFLTQTTDPSGITSFDSTAVEELIDVDIVFDSINAISIKKTLKNIKGSPSAFILDESSGSIYENLVTIGVIDDFTIVITNPNKTFATISIQEVL